VEVKVTTPLFVLDNGDGGTMFTGGNDTNTMLATGHTD